MSALRIATLIGDPEREAALAAGLARRDDVDLVIRCVDRVELLASIRGGELDALVAVGAPRWLDKRSAEEAATAGLRVIGLVADPLEAEILAAVGADLIPGHAPVDEVIDRCRFSEIAEPLPSTQPSAPRGKLVAVWGPKGAPGRTTIALELAAQLAAAKPATLLLDGDPYGGDALQALGIVDELPTIVWAAQMAARSELDAARLALDLRRAYPGGPVLLPGLTRSDLWAEVSEPGWRELLTVARATFDMTVCDVGFCLEIEAPTVGMQHDGRNHMARSTISAADHVIAVVRADPIGLKGFLWAYDKLREIADDDDVLVVANRVRDEDQRDVGDLLRRHIGKRAIAYIPERPEHLRRSVLAGAPLHVVEPRSDVCANVRPIAAAIGTRPQPTGVLARVAGRL